MGLFESIKRTFNLSGCELRLQPIVDIVHQGEQISGTVWLRGGEYAQEATALNISLVEFWTESRGSGKNRSTVTVTNKADSACLASPCIIALGAELEYQFSLTLPTDGRLSTPGESTGWRLCVELDIPAAIDPSSTLDLRVVPAIAVLELVHIWSKILHWSEVPTLRSWDRSQRSTGIRLKPPAELHSDFDHLDLSCRPLPDGDWHATMTFDLQEKKMVDRLKAIVNLDTTTRSLRISAAALAGESAARITLASELVHLMKEIVDARP